MGTGCNGIPLNRFRRIGRDEWLAVEGCREAVIVANAENQVEHGRSGFDLKRNADVDRAIDQTHGVGDIGVDEIDVTTTGVVEADTADARLPGTVIEIRLPPHFAIRCTRRYVHPEWRVGIHERNRNRPAYQSCHWADFPAGLSRIRAVDGVVDRVFVC